MKYKLLLILALAGLVVLFIVQNVAVAEIQVLFWSIKMSLSLLMFLVLAVGIVMGWSLHGYFRYRKGKTK